MEDNVLNRRVAMGYLQETRAEVIVADNGHVALDLIIQHNDVDVVLNVIQALSVVTQQLKQYH